MREKYFCTTAGVTDARQEETLIMIRTLIVNFYEYFMWIY